MNCYCGTNRDFPSCCEPFISNKQKPTTAEELMRSRYSAFATGNIDYIESTQTFKFNKSERLATELWAKESKWLKLEIIATHNGQKGDKYGIVEFKAFYLDSLNSPKVHHEISHFAFKKKWFFQEGQTP